MQINIYQYACSQTDKSKPISPQTHLPINQQIRRLQIPMQDPMVMTIRHTRQQLIQKTFQYRQIQPCIAYIQILF